MEEPGHLIQYWPYQNVFKLFFVNNGNYFNVVWSADS